MTGATTSEVKGAQAALADRGFYSGTLDGDWGPATQRAFDAAMAAIPLAVPPAAASRVVYPRQADLAAFYGPAGGPACTAGVVKLPFPFIIAWDASQKVSTFRCHQKVEAPLAAIFAEAAAHYGETTFRKLRLDLFGGCYNYRQMRGGAQLSTHAWGIAVDLDPERNQLKWGADKAAFARPEYEPFWKIVEAHGAVSLGRARDYDWQHFQFARL